MMLSIVTSLNKGQKMSQQTKNSCTKAFGNCTKEQKFKAKKIEGGGQIDPPPLCLLGLITDPVKDAS